MISDMTPGTAVQDLSLPDLLQLFYNSGKSLRMVHGQIGQHLAVEVKSFGIELADELGVAHVVLTHRRVDTLDPQATHAAFFVLAVAVSVS